MSISRTESRPSSESRSRDTSAIETAKPAEAVKPKLEETLAAKRNRDAFEEPVQLANTLTPSQWATQRGLDGVEATKTNADKYHVS